MAASVCVVVAPKTRLLLTVSKTWPLPVWAMQGVFRADCQLYSSCARWWLLWTETAAGNAWGGPCGLVGMAAAAAVAAVAVVLVLVVAVVVAVVVVAAAVD
jgi:hypothetical protein